MSLPIEGFSHVRITVTDIARSRRFYDDVLGLPVAFEMPADADAATREQNWWLFDGVVYQVPGGFFGLRRCFRYLASFIRRAKSRSTLTIPTWSNS